MIKKIIEKCSETKSLVFWGIIFFTLCGLANTLWKQDYIYLTQTYRYSAKQAYELLNTIGLVGRVEHLKILWVDVAMVISYTLFLLGLNYRMITQITSNCHWISGITFSILPLSLIQTLEVIFTAILIRNADSKYENLANLSSTLTAYKFYFTPICYGLPIILVGAKIVKNTLLHRKNRIKNGEKECKSTL